MNAQLKEKKSETTIQPNKARTRELIAVDIRREMTALVLGKRKWPWYLWGPPGVGKTCAALCMLDFASGRYWTADQWAADLNDARLGHLDEHRPAKVVEKIVEVPHDRAGPDGVVIHLKPGDRYACLIQPSQRMVVKPSDLWARVKAAALFVLDDVGMRTVASEHQLLSVKRILDDRCGLPTVVIGNREPRELAGIYGAATARRMIEGTITLYREKFGLAGFEVGGGRHTI